MNSYTNISKSVCDKIDILNESNNQLEANIEELKNSIDIYKLEKVEELNLSKFMLKIYIIIYNVI